MVPVCSAGPYFSSSTGINEAQSSKNVRDHNTFIQFQYLGRFTTAHSAVVGGTCARSVERLHGHG